MTSSQENLAAVLRLDGAKGRSKSFSALRVSISLGVLFCLLTSNTAPLSGQASAAGAGQEDLAQIAIGTTPGQEIPATFMGIAHEWGDAQAIMGSSETGVNVIYRNLLSNLTAYGSGPIIVRVGGNSTDESGEPTPSTVRPFAELARATGAHFYLGVNLGKGNPQLAVDQARAFVSQMPPNSLDAIEIGNEPDSYVNKRMRPPTYPFSDYLGEFDTWRQALFPLLKPPTLLMGPSWAVVGSLKYASQFLEAEHSYLYAFSQHFYTGDACNSKVNPADLLLSPKNAVGGPSRIRAAVIATHEYHLPFRLDELNSIACGGQDGVSNAFGSALWAIDIMFEFANVGVDGINWQSPNGNAYSSLDFSMVKTGMTRSYAIKTVRPLYFGMLFFQAATGRQARLLPVSVNTGQNLKAWATIDATGVVRLTVINKSTTSGNIRISMPGFRDASILRLTAPSTSSKQGVTFAGQSLDNSPDGRLQGTKRVETLVASGGGFVVPMAAGSAFIAEFRR